MTAHEADMRARIAAFVRNPAAVDNLARLLRGVAGRTGKKSSEEPRRYKRERALARIEFYGN